MYIDSQAEFCPGKNGPIMQGSQQWCHKKGSSMSVFVAFISVDHPLFSALPISSDSTWSRFNPDSHQKAGLWSS
jgi:hypothetical protein